MNRLILIEGLPGTGKTAISQWLCDLLRKKGESVVLLIEDDESIPSNFRDIAGIPKNIFNSSFADSPAISSSVLKQTEHYVYLNINKCYKEMQDDIRRWDIGDECNTSLSLQDYIMCTLEWWYDWAQNHTGKPITIMDSAFMQNPINEMIFRKATNPEIKPYISAIAELLAPLSPLCIYLRRNSAAESIEYAKAAKGPKWSEAVDQALQQSGCTDLFQRRFELEYELLSAMQHFVCEIQGGDWSEAKIKIQNHFAKQLFCENNLQS